MRFTKKNIVVKPHTLFLKNKIINAEEHYKELFKLWPLVWAKIYKKSFLDAYNIRFPDGLIYEDNPFVISCYIRNPSITFINEHLHYYRMIRDGKISNKGNKRTIQIFDIIRIIKNDLKNQGKYDYLYPILINWIVENTVWLFGLTPKANRKAFFMEMKKLFQEDFLWLTKRKLLKLKNEKMMAILNNSYFSLILNRFRYKLLSKITFGKLKYHYKRKKKLFSL